MFTTTETASPAGILIYGRDLPLVETRRWILEKAGYTVFAAMEHAAAEHILRFEQIELSILCHTLSKEQQEKVLATGHDWRPTMKRLLLATEPLPSLDGEPGGIFYASAGPRALVEIVNRLMGR